jgi:hypothetical protein
MTFRQTIDRWCDNANAARSVFDSRSAALSRSAAVRRNPV